MKSLLWIFVHINDIDGNWTISKDEFSAQLTGQGLVTFDEKNFNAYPLDKDGCILKKDLLDGLFEYYCNGDENNVCGLEKATCYRFRLIDNI